MGRTRPKKLTPKASIPIVSENEIDIIDDEVQSSLQQVETGVEKAEESVSRVPIWLILAAPCTGSRDIILNVRPCVKFRSWPARVPNSAC